MTACDILSLEQHLVSFWSKDPGQIIIWISSSKTRHTHTLTWKEEHRRKQSPIILLCITYEKYNYILALQFENYTLAAIVSLS